MDEETWAQDVLRCHICENPVPPLHCSICHTHLCKACVGEHILDESTEHKVVPFNKREFTIKCSKHTTKVCELYCKTCKTSICTSCASSDEHRGHVFVEVMEYFENQKKAIQQDEQELEDSIILQYEELALKIPQQRDELNQNSNTVTTAITDHGKKLHEEIDILKEIMKSNLTAVYSNEFAALSGQETDITKTISEIKQTIDDLKKLKKSNDLEKILEFRSTNEHFRKIPSALEMNFLSFTPHKMIPQQFGILSGLPVKEENKSCTAIAPVSVPSLSERPLIRTPRIITSMCTDYESSNGLRSLCCLNDELIWTCGYKDNMLRLYNIHGELVEEVRTMSRNPPYDIAVTNSGDLIYADFKDRTINIVTDKKVITAIRVHGWKPRNVCSTSSGDILVVMDRDDFEETKVSRFSDFVEKQTIQNDDNGRPLYSRGGDIKYITENGNGDICVSDFIAYAVVVVNRSGKLRFTYTGPPFSTERPFEPYGIATDSQCRILTADYRNDLIHIIDKDGHFLRYIDNCALHAPWDLYVDTRDNLFVTECETTLLKKIQYYVSTKPST